MNGGTRPPTAQPRARIAPPTLQALLETQFHGATGLVRFQAEWTKSRKPSDVPFGVYNTRLAKVDRATGLGSYRAVPTHVKFPGDSNFRPAHEDARFISHGGRTDVEQAPPLLVGQGTGLDAVWYCRRSGHLLHDWSGGIARGHLHQDFSTLLYAAAVLWLAHLGIFHRDLVFDEGTGWTESELDGALFPRAHIVIFGTLHIMATRSSLDAGKRSQCLRSLVPLSSSSSSRWFC